MKNNTSRIAVAGLFATAVLLGALPGCAKSASTTPAEGGTDKVTAQGTGQGIDGDVIVEVTADATTIYSIEVIEQNETPGIGSIACDDLPGAMVKANSYNVDAIAGATVTSNALKDAVKAALEAAGLDPEAFATPVAAGEAVEKSDETLDVDVVIVGAGGAGLTAAVVATQEGSNVLVLEKMPLVGGNSLKASGGMNAAGTKKQEAQLAGETDEKKKESLSTSTVENFIADTMKGGHDINDIELVTKMAEESSAAIDWLEENGAPLPTIAATGGTVHMYLHEPEDGSAVGTYLVEKLNNKANELGIEVKLNTTATELIVTDGAVTGVKAEDAEHNYTINAKAVILATGGFGANFEMMASYDPSLANAVTTNHPGATGDGINMAVAIGADTVDMEKIQLHPTVFQETGFLVSERLRSNGAILVNKEGNRFTNDLATRDAVSQAELKQPDAFAWIVYDSQFAEEKLYQKYVAQGMTVTGETLEALAAEMGFDADATANFTATVEKWNDAVANGNDEFERNNGLVSLSEGPYYAIKIAPGIHHTMGGLKINTETEVLTTEGKAIAGLYAAGETTGGVHGGNRIGGNAVCDFVVFGRIAGANASAYAAK